MVRPMCKTCTSVVGLKPHVLSDLSAPRYRTQRANAWAASAFWDRGTCRVLNWGRAYRGTCSAYGETDSYGS
eukprot:5582755-Alexandrium_andersonii.AAC.1